MPITLTFTNPSFIHTGALKKQFSAYLVYNVGKVNARGPWMDCYLQTFEKQSFA